LKKEKISKIYNSYCSADCEKAYIGSVRAYQLFVEYRENEKKILIDQCTDDRFIDFCAITKSFEKVVSKEKIDSVGGLSVGIMESKGNLYYQQKISIISGPMVIKITQEPTAVPFGSAANGSHSVNFLSSEAGEGPSCLAIHLHFGNIGILWGAGHRIRPIVITNCMHDSLIEVAMTEFGAAINGMKIG
jgi:hypothetical protein